jgi:hypothetical protein
MSKYHRTRLGKESGTLDNVIVDFELVILPFMIHGGHKLVHYAKKAGRCDIS